MTRAWQKESERYLVFPKGFDCILSHPKVAAYGYGFRQWFQHDGLPAPSNKRDFWMTSFPLVERSTGDRFGPVVCYTHVDKIADHLMDLGLNNDSSKNVINAAIDQYIKDNLSTSTNDQYTRFATTYASIVAEAELVKQKKLNEYADQRWKNKRIKLKKVKTIVKKLSEVIDRRFKERILAYTVNVDALTFRYRNVPVITWQYMNNRFLNQKMKSCVSRPSSMFNKNGSIKKKELMKLVPSINDHLSTRELEYRWRIMRDTRPGRMDKVLRQLTNDWTPPNDSDSDSE